MALVSLEFMFLRFCINTIISLKIKLGSDQEKWSYLFVYLPVILSKNKQTNKRCL